MLNRILISLYNLKKNSYIVLYNITTMKKQSNTIRKMLFGASLILLTSGGLFAQEDKAKKFDIRVYGGFNIMQLTSDKDNHLLNNVVHQKKVSGRPGFQAGVAATFGKRFFVQPGVQYTYVGTKIVSEETTTNTTFEDVTYLKIISVPLKVGVKLLDPSKQKLINVRLFGGLDGHHVLDVEHTGYSKDNGLKTYSKDDYSNLILNADFGMGLDIFIFYIDIGYQLGLTPVHAQAGDNAKANSFYGNLGLKFSF